MFISKLIGGKRRWRHYRSRVKALPEPYRSAVDAIERYLMSFGRGDGAGWAEQLEDLADLFEQAAVVREQERLTNTIARAAGEGTRNHERAVR